MKRVVQTAHGAPGDVLDVAEAPLADPGPDEVQVSVLVAPILPMDHLRIRGLYPLAQALPGTPGSVGVGRVLFGNRWIGELVVLPMRAGSWAQTINVPIEGCILLDGEVDPVQAALARVNGLTAQALLSGLDRGSWVVMNAGNGGVSRYAQRLCRRMGVKTIALVREGVDHASIEADLVLNDDPSALDSVRAAVDRPIHRALDGVGGSSTERLGSLLATGGRVVHYGATSRQSPRLSVADTIFRGVLLQGFWLYRVDQMRGMDEAGHILNRLLELGIEGDVDSTWALDDVHDALARDRHPDRHGRVVFTPNAVVN